MSNKPLLIVMGEPQSIFPEIYFKTYKKIIKNKINFPILLIGSFKLLNSQMKFFKYKFKIKKIEITDLNKMNNNCINIIDVNLDFKKSFGQDCKNRSEYINQSFDIALKILKKKGALGVINGPISKTKFLQKKFLGVTEFIAYKTKSKSISMLIYNKNFSVSPITTHLPVKKISKSLSKIKIEKKVQQVNNFYKTILKKKFKAAILGLNPHCESNEKLSEEEKIIIPAIKNLRRRKINIKGPFSADTFFIKENLKKYNVVFGMYHDQVLTPIKTLYGFNAVNLTIGLPFVRLSPDHGPNEKMLSKNLSSPLSLIESIEFFKRINVK